MNGIVIDTEVRDYLDAVKGYLADLPAEELDDLTLDLESHLVEVHAESAGSLTERLGSPAAYAAELRASAGFDRVPPPPPSLVDRAAARARELAARPEAERARRAWESFRPVWIAIRGWLLVTLWVVATAQGGTVFETFPIPRFGSTLVGLALVALATAASYAAAERAGSSRRWRRGDAAFTAIVAVLLLAAVVAGPELRDGQAVFFDGPSEEEIVANYPLVGVGNIFAYDLSGRPLDAVLLFDQDGNPLDLYPWTERGNEEVQFRTDRFGEPIKNGYPVQQFRYEAVIHEETGAEDAGYVPVPPPRVPLPDVAAEPPAADPAPLRAETPVEPPPTPATPRFAPR